MTLGLSLASRPFTAVKSSLHANNGRSPSSKATMTTVSLEQAKALAKQNLLGIFGERDANKRLAQIKTTYASNITFHEPDKTVVGYEAVDKIVSQLLESNPQWAFRTAGQLWVNHNMITLEWEFGPEGRPAIVHGNDIMIVNADGQIDTLYTMIKGVSDVEVL